METDRPASNAPPDAAAATAPTPPGMRTVVIKNVAWPKGLSRRFYLSKPPGRERKELLAIYRDKNPVKTRTITYRPIVRQPWNHNKPAAETTVQPVDKIKKAGWSTRMSKEQRKEYVALKRGTARREYLNRVRKEQGVAPIKAKVPRSVELPQGLNLQEFYARDSGRARMAYLAKYLKRNNLELKTAPTPSTGYVGPPIGRSPEPLAHPHCGCSSSEACSSCSRCVELHCICGLTGRQRRAVCLESRACSCSLADPTMRCKLCHGCRQSQGPSHCRCVLHQRQLWIKRHPELEEELTEEEEEMMCSCFLLAHRHGGAVATAEKEAKALTETERARRIKRATGFPSSDNLYRSKKITAFLGEDGVERDFDDGVEDGLGSEVLPTRTEDVIPRPMARRMLDPEYNPASYHPLFRSEGCSLLESIEPRGGRISRKQTAALTSGALGDEISRGLENFVYEADRNATMPSDDLVDFLVYMASIKTANIGELIGTFDDSAAIGGSIVIEEYMAQLIEDVSVHQRAVCSPTASSVKKFTEDLLIGFNWKLFRQHHPCLPVDSQDKDTTLEDKAAALVLREFVSTQPKDFDVDAHTNDLTRWIRSAIVIPEDSPANEEPWQSGTGGQTIETTSTSRGNGQNNEGGAAPAASPLIRLSVKSNPVYGNPAYKLHFATTLEDGHHVETSVGGLDSKVKAKTTITQLSKVVERQELRSKGLLEPPPPPPPLKPLDPNDPYVEMHAHLRKHFGAFSATQPDSSKRKREPRGPGRPRKEKKITPC